MAMKLEKKELNITSVKTVTNALQFPIYCVSTP